MTRKRAASHKGGRFLFCPAAFFPAFPPPRIPLPRPPPRIPLLRRFSAHPLPLSPQNEEAATRFVAFPFFGLSAFSPLAAGRP